MSEAIQGSNQVVVAPAARAALALKSADVEKELLALAESSKDITAVIDPVGREQAHRIGMNLRKRRTGIRDDGKAAREDATKFSKAVIVEEDRLVAIIENEEKRIIGLRDAYDAEQQRIEAEKIAKERARMERLESMVMDLSDFPHALMAEAEKAAVPSVVYARGIAELEACNPSEEVYEEYVPKAVDAIAKSLATLREIYAGALAKEEAARAEAAAKEAEAKRMAAERAELARQKAEQERVAAELAAQKKALDDAEAARVAEQAERDRVAADNIRQMEAQQAAINAARVKLEEDQAAAEVARQAAIILERDHAEALVMNQQVDEARYSLAWVEAHRMNTEFDILRLEQDHSDALAMNAQIDADRLARDHEEALMTNLEFNAITEGNGFLTTIWNGETFDFADKFSTEPTDQEIIDCYVESFGGTQEKAIARLSRFSTVAA